MNVLQNSTQKHNYFTRVYMGKPPYRSMTYIEQFTKTVRQNEEKHRQQGNQMCSVCFAKAKYIVDESTRCGTHARSMNDKIIRTII
tara:strand:+ start:311 stop:568 length:258 start_codon:yes stop_codon:yes gene_type:complete